MLTPTEILNAIYQNAQSNTATDLLTPDQRIRVSIIVDYAENHKGVLAALITSLTKKIETPTQDIRLHKTIFPDGYSGRSYDFNIITSFIRQKFGRLAMAESGWLTRSIEQPHPFTLDFPGKIQNIAVKQAFLEIIDDIETHGISAESYLTTLFHDLILLVGGYESMLIVPRPTQFITVARIMQLLDSHFNYRYASAGGSLLPVVALFSVYRAMMDLPRYKGKTLVSLKGHTNQWCECLSPHPVHLSVNRPSPTRGEGQKTRKSPPRHAVGEGDLGGEGGMGSQIVSESVPYDPHHWL